MPTSEFIIKRFLLEFLIFTNFGYVFPRSVPSMNQRPTPQFEHNFQSSLALHPFHYDHSNLQAYQLHEPVGTFYDSKRGILRSFPGGGVPVLVDHHKRCSNNFVGIKPHPNQRQYYYVCKPDCVIFGKCQNLQSFDATKVQCIPNSTPDYSPVCTRPGSFPISTDCSIYYKCDAQLKPRIFSCPRNTVFAPHKERCICGAHCNPTKVSPHGSHIPQDSEHKFPPCLQDGTFRTPTDCALYYTCAKQQGALYLQTRFKCPELEFFDPAQGTCRPQHQVACDSIQLSELVFPRPPPIPHLPVIYPAHYSMDFLDDSEYPTEYYLSCSKEDTVSASVSSSEGTSLNSSAQTTKSAKSSTVLTTVTTVIPSRSITPKEASSLKISTSTLRDDISTSTINISTPSSFPTSTFGITSTTIDENSHDQMLTSKDVSTESFPPKAFPTTNSISAGASPSTASSLNPSIANFVTTLSPDMISGPTSSSNHFLSSNIHTGESLSPIAFSSTTSFRDPTFKPVLTTDITTINTILASTAGITTTPVVSTSLTPLPTTRVSTSTTIKRSFPTIAHASSPLINKVDNSSPNVISSSVGIIRTTTMPTSGAPPHTSLPITTLSPLDFTTSDRPTVHSNIPFVETATQRSISVPVEPSMPSPATSNLREITTTMSSNTESLSTKSSSVTTSSILSDSPPIRPIEETNETIVMPTVSSLFSPEKTLNTVTNTLNQNEVRSIRSSLSTGSVTAEENNALEKEVDTELNSNEFENLGNYKDYESGFEATEISKTDKSVQSEILDDNIKPLNTSSLITNTENDNNTSVKGTEGVMNDSHDSRFSNDVSYYEDNVDYFEDLSSSTASGPHIETLSTTQSTSLKLNISLLSTRSLKRDAPNYNFQIHNNYDKQTNDKSDSTDTEVSKYAIQSIENSTELGSNINIAITTPSSVSSIRTDNNLINENLVHLHVEDSTVVKSCTESNLNDLNTSSTTAGYNATMNTYVDSGDSQTKVLTKVQTNYIEEFSKGTTDARLTNSATGVHPIVDINTSTFTRNAINNIDENLIIDNEFQISGENATKIQKGEESMNSSKISITVNGKDDIGISQTAIKATTEPTTFKVARQAVNQINNSFEYSNEYSTLNENEIFITESPSKAFTVKSEIEVINITESSSETTTAAEVLSIERLRNKHPLTHEDLLETYMISSTTPTATTYYGQEASAKALLSSSTEVNLTVRDLKKSDPIPKLVGILLPPHIQKPSQNNKRIEESINFGKNYTDQEKSHTNPQYLKIDRNLNYATTVSTLTETPYPKEIIINHFERTGDVMKSTEPEKPFDSFEKSTGLIKIKDRFQNNNSNEGDRQGNPQPPTSKSKSLRNNVIFKACTNDLPLSSSKIFTTNLSQSTTTPNPITTVKEKYLENTTVRSTHLGIKFQDNFVNIESNDLRTARNVPNTNILQDTPQIYKGIYRTQTPVPNSNCKTVTGFPIHATDIPKLEVVVFGNLDLTVLYCPKDCSKQHEHKYDKKVFGDQHVVGIQWDPAKSKKTMSIQTV